MIVPTTEQIRTKIQNMATVAGRNPLNAVADFDIWFAEHTRSMQEQAWDHAVSSIKFADGTPVSFASVINPYARRKDNQ
jgi:hypothetical protein